MKKSALMAKLNKRCKSLGLPNVLLSHGGSHDVLTLKWTKISVPRHAEIPQYTCEGIMKAFEIHLGKDWWRNE